MIAGLKRSLKFRLSEDTSYKLVAFFVSLVLWVTILGRKNSVVTKDVDLEILVRNNFVVANEVRKTVRVQVSGPRVVLKKFTQNQQLYTIDLWDSEPGKQKIPLNHTGLNLPVGLKLVSITPNEIMVVVRELGKKKEGN